MRLARRRLVGALGFSQAAAARVSTRRRMAPMAPMALRPAPPLRAHAPTYLDSLMTDPSCSGHFPPFAAHSPLHLTELDPQALDPRGLDPQALDPPHRPT